MRAAGEKRNRDGLDGTLPEVRRNVILKQNEVDGEKKEVEVDEIKEVWIQRFFWIFDRVLDFMMKILKNDKEFEFRFDFWIKLCYFYFLVVK